MTIGKKLFICFGALLGFTIALGAYALVSIGSLGAAATNLGVFTAHKLYLACDINTATSDLLAVERGILLRAFMNDKAAMEQFNQDRRVKADHAKKSIAELASLVENPQVKQILADIQTDVERADGIHDQEWQLLSNGKLEAAALMNRNTLAPLLMKISDRGQKLAEAEMPIMSKAAAEAQASVSRSRWITFCVISLSLVLGVCVVFVVRQVSDSLRRMVTDLGNGGEQVASASGQIAATSQSLSQGSSEQAASLEEISASMEEMTAMAKRNTENSAEATAMMTETATQVEQSNAALHEMVVSMSAIKTSSEKVAKIINTIDEIAFQTNILALNAAVEAARAGEAGMGFAVVADEVRNLAHRSAVAAKDTAGLIEEAIANSNQGAVKLEQVAVFIRAITESANRVKGLVQEVSESSKQQTIGIDQASTAVTQVSRVTQTAAASAEESAAASEELSAQAQTMRDLVLVLSAMVDGNASGVPAAVRPAQARSLASFRPNVAISRPVAKTAPPVTRYSSSDDPFPMETISEGSFRSF